MSYFIQQGNKLSVSDDAAIEVHRQLPIGNYTVKVDAFGNFYLEMIDSFESVGKIYGSTTKWANRVLDTFNSRPSGTGILLSGEKGSGKTLLAKTISRMAAERGIPTLSINQPLCGESFNKFIQDIDIPCVILFDEFEKVYDREHQQQLLTLLDGMYPTKKLFVMTCNDVYRVDAHMNNRPGRIFYAISFDGLENEFVEEYAKDNLKNKDHVQSVCRVASLFSAFNFDMLKALVEEMNRYNETAHDAMKLLNAKPHSSEYIRYTVSVSVAGKLLGAGQFAPAEWQGNPVNRDLQIVVSSAERAKTKTSRAVPVKARLRGSNRDDDDSDDIINELLNQNGKMNQNVVVFSPSEHLMEVNPKDGTFTYKNGDYVVTLTKVRYAADDHYSRLF